jgi:hypothetical protein
MTLAMDGMSSCCQQINAVPPQAMASAATLSISLFLCVFGVSPSLLGMALWGVGLGAQKAILKAAIVGMVPSERRGTAYGLDEDQIRRYIRDQEKLQQDQDQGELNFA